jgi:hypothetical protein
VARSSGIDGVSSIGGRQQRQRRLGQPSVRALVDLALCPGSKLMQR